MNKTTKPISSPGRSTEKFPPPLMRFLRSNVGNKSRRRSRASPMSMFVKKKNTPFETTIQEPSSPKVTCIGQVRVRRSNKKKNHNHRLCRCLRTVKSFSLITVWSKCVMFFRCVSCCCCCCSNSSNNNHAKKHLQHQKEKQIQQEEKQEDQEDIERRQQHKIEQEISKHVALHVDDINVGLIPKTPPKNAFLLTRCRSAPYRSANSLASMFKESMVENDHESEVEEKIKIEKEDESIKKFKIKKEDEGEDDEEGTSNESDGCEESKVVPLILSRCKSEPARTWDQLHLV